MVDVMSLSPRLTSDDLERITQIASEVLGSADPRFKLESDERWRAELSGTFPTYSGLLRTGISEVLVLSNVFSSRTTAIPNADIYAQKVVRSLLHDADAERWWSLHRQLKILAEAAPGEFLNAVENSLDKNDLPIMQLFVEGKDVFGFGGGGEYSHLLWALELLAWSPDYLSKVTILLAKLTRLDPGGRLSNRPLNSFLQIYKLWHPQTSATLDERMIILNRLRKIEPDVSWKLMLELYPKSHDAAHDSPVPRWRGFSTSLSEPVTHALIIRGAEKLGRWLLEDVGENAERWDNLIEKFSDFAPEMRRGAIDRLCKIAPLIRIDEDRLRLQSALRRLLNHHRQFEDAGWALPVQHQHL
jgi:hypothetical protein